MRSITVKMKTADRQERESNKAQDRIPDTVYRCLPFSLRDALSPFGTVAEEIRIRRDGQVSVTVGTENRLLPHTEITAAGMEEIFRALCGGSPYAYEETLKQGFLSLPGGVRVGISGRASVQNGVITGIRDISGICIRLPGRPTVSGEIVKRFLEADQWSRGVLIWSPPGVGKTTLLRGTAVSCSSGSHPKRTVLVDTREEFSGTLPPGTACLEVLSGYPKGLGIEIACRTLNAQVILCDEIGREETEDILRAANCGVPLIASAHAANLSGLLSRPGFSELHRAGVFGTYLGIRRGERNEFRYDACKWEVADCDFQSNR